MSATVRIANELLPYIDDVVEGEKDEFGMLKYRSRADFVNEAVKEFLNKHGVNTREGEEAAP